MKHLFRFVSVVMIAAGLGLLVYGAMADRESYRAPFGLQQLLATPQETLAWGVGILVGGCLFLLVFGLRMPAMDKPGKQ